MGVFGPEPRPGTGRVGAGISRRSFLRAAGGLAAGLAASGVLSACSSQPIAATAGGPPAPRPDNPVTWPITKANAPIAAGLAPERGATVQILTWDQYINPAILTSFGKEFGCKTEVTTFFDMDEGIAKLRAGVVPCDVFFPTVDVVSSLIADGDLQPLNHAYLPNLDNVWQELRDPFYDVGSRYSVPYSIYTTGIGWRNDLVKVDIAAMSNPYEIFWDTAYKGYVYLLDDYREAITMVLLRNGVTNILTGDPAVIAQAGKDLDELTSLVNIKWSNDDYTLLPEGQAYIHQAWSGDMTEAPYYGKGTANQVAPTLSYWFPDDHKGPVGSDTMVIPRGAHNPVLAHELLNYVLNNKIALENFGWVGYQQPLYSITPATVRYEFPWCAKPNMEDCLVTPADLQLGYYELQLTPAVDAIWQQTWNQFQAGD